MKNLRWNVLFLLLLVLALGGCAKNEVNMVSDNMLTPNQPKSIDGKISTGIRVSFGENKVNLLIKPSETLGLKLTPSILNGEVDVYKGTFNDRLLGESYPGRIRWNCIVRQNDGKEFFAQALFSPLDYTGKFTWHFVIDGHPDKTARIIQISTMIEYGYSAYGDEYKIEDRIAFLENKGRYRAKFIDKYGTKLSELKQVDTGEFYRNYIGNWNTWGTDDAGDLLSPFGIEEIKKIAAINPQYSFGQKLIANGRFMLCADPIAVLASGMIDSLVAANAASAGWDYSSELPSRRLMGLIIEWVMREKDKLIYEINRQKAFGFYGGRP